MKKILGVLVGATLLLSACAGSGDSSTSEDPKGALVDALEGLLETEALTQTLSVQSDTDSLVALGEGSIDEDAAAKILDSSLVVSAVQGANPAEAKSQIVFNLAGSPDLEIRLVDGDLYLRADVAHIMETFEQDPAQLDAVVTQVQGQPGFEWVQPALAGEWISVKNALELTEQLGAGAANTLSGEQQEKLVKDLLQSVEQNATVTDEGEDDAGAHVKASLPLKETLRDLLESLGPAANLPAAQLEEGLAEVPDDLDLVIDFWIEDGTVSQIGFDILQFAEVIAEEGGEEIPEGVEEFSIIAAFEEFDGEVEPVADAVEIDTDAVMQSLTGLMGGGLGGVPAGGGGSGFDCSALKGAPAEVIELYAEECPELQG